MRSLFKNRFSNANMYLPTNNKLIKYLIWHSPPLLLTTKYIHKGISVKKIISSILCLRVIAILRFPSSGVDWLGHRQPVRLYGDVNNVIVLKLVYDTHFTKYS